MFALPKTPSPQPFTLSAGYFQILGVGTVPRTTVMNQWRKNVSFGMQKIYCGRVEFEGKTRKLCRACLASRPKLPWQKYAAITLRLTFFFPSPGLLCKSFGYLLARPHFSRAILHFRLWTAARWQMLER